MRIVTLSVLAVGKNEGVNMDSKLFSKRNIIIAAIIIFLILVIIIIALFKKSKTQDITSTTAISQIIKQNVLFPALSQDKQKIYFFSNSNGGAFYGADLNGQNVQKISGDMDTPDEVIWSPDQQIAVLKVTYDQYAFEKYGSVFASPGTPDQILTNWVYNFKTKKLGRLDDNITSAVWRNDQIIYQQLDQEKNISILNSANANGKNPSKIIDLPENLEYNLSLTDDNKLILTSMPSDNSPGKTYLLNLETKNLQEQQIQVANKAVGLSSSYILFSKFSQNSATDLFLYDLEKQKFADLKLRSLIDNVLILDNNDFLLINTEKGENVIAKYDISAGKLTKIAKLTQENPFNLISVSDKILFFTSDNSLYKVEVK